MCRKRRGNFLMVTTVPFGLRSASAQARPVAHQAVGQHRLDDRALDVQASAGWRDQSADEVADLLVVAKQKLFDQMLRAVCHPQVVALGPHYADLLDVRVVEVAL